MSKCLVCGRESDAPVMRGDEMVDFYHRSCFESLEVNDETR